MIDRTPQILVLAVHLPDHLLEMPAPMPKLPHGANPAPPDVGSKCGLRLVGVH